MQYHFLFRNIFFSCLIIFSLFHNSFCIAYEHEVNALSFLLTDKIVKSGKKSVAIINFTDLNGNVTELGKFLAEEFSSSISESEHNFKLIDRTHLESIILEHKLSFSGFINPSSAKKMGLVAGVEALVTGTITPFGDTIRISIKIIDTETAMIIASVRGNIAKTPAIEALDDLYPYHIGDFSRSDNPQTTQLPPTAWKRSPVWFGGKEGPVDQNGYPWNNPLFSDASWENISLPDYGNDSSANDRYYRKHFYWQGNSAVKLNFASDDGLSIFINGNLLGNWGFGWRKTGCVNNPKNQCGKSMDIEEIVVPSSILNHGDNIIAVDLWNGNICCHYYIEISILN